MSTKKKQAYLLTLIVITALSCLAVIATLVAFPTAEHVETARSMKANQMNPQLHATFSSSATAKYSDTLSAVGGVVQFIAFVVATVLTYNRLRSKRLVKNPGGITLAIITAASVVSFVANEFFFSTYVGSTGLLEAGIGVYAVTTAANALLTVAFAFIVVLIAEKRYDKKHSFAVE